jgi:GTPase
MEKVGISANEATKLALQFTQNLKLQSIKSDKKSLKEILLDPIETFEFIKEKIKDARECVVEIGLFEDGESMGLGPEEVKRITLQIENAANKLNADATIIHSTDTTHMLVRMKPTASQEFIELRICVAGNVDAGKSTLLGVLTKNVLDDGRGNHNPNPRKSPCKFIQIQT